jgi:triosephosphate isomerase
MRKLIAGTGWKMNNGMAATIRYVKNLKARLKKLDTSAIEVFVLPPFISLAAAAKALKGTPVGVGGQNVHWEDSGAWTGEISAPMLVEAGCAYVELGHAERREHFGETDEHVQYKVNAAMRAGLAPIVCLGERGKDRVRGKVDAMLSDQLMTAIGGQDDEDVAKMIFAYEPRWAIGKPEPAPVDYVRERHHALREVLRRHCGKEVSEETRIIYGGAASAENGRAILELEDVDGLFVGRAGWTPEGFANVVELVAAVARQGKESSKQRGNG